MSTTESSGARAPVAVSAIVPDEGAGCWEIQGFSYFSTEKGTGYASKELAEVAGAKVKLLLYPGGHEDVRGEGFSSIYVQFDSSQNFWVSYEISLVDKATGKLSETRKDPKFFVDDGHRCKFPQRSSRMRGFPIYVRTAELQRIAQQANDVLQLELVIKGWPESPLVRETGKLLELQPPSALSKDLAAMLHQGTATDVSLRISDASREGGVQILHAHKFVLAARSPVFRQMLFTAGMAEASNAEVNIIDAEAKVVLWFLDFLYTDELPLEVREDDDALCHLLALADKYQVQPLVERCEAGIVTGLSVENACERLMMADLLGVEGLKKSVLQYMGASRSLLAQVQGSDGFSRLAQRRPQLVVEMLALAVPPQPKRRKIAASDLPENLQGLTVSDLRRLLNDRGLAINGAKPALVARLQAARDAGGP